ncbi:MAG: FHA domain-containing protein [Oligoflexia bacterium]|nr:FHA domain-containing protein [Oligoflexia bacterium]
MEENYQQQYVLDIKGKKYEDSIPVEWDQYTIGSSERSDLCIEDQKLAPVHIKLRVQNDILTVTNLGGDKATSIGWQKLTHGKMYILDEGDKLSLGNLKIKIKVENVEYVDDSELSDPEIDTPPQLDSLDTDDLDDSDADEDEDVTDPNVEIPENDESDIDELDDVTDPNVEIPDGEVEEDDEDEDDEDSDAEAFENEASELEDDEPTEPRKGLPKFSKPSDKLSIKKAKGKYIAKGPLPGPISRLSYLTFNISLVVMTKFFFFNHFELNQMWNEQWKKVWPHIIGNIEKYYPIVEKLVPKDSGAKITPFVKSSTTYEFLALYIILCVITSILFSKSIGYAFGLVMSDGNLITNRIKALFRGIFAVITTPFIIFDLPLLIGKRSLKEVLSGTRFYFSNRFVKIISAPLVFFLCLILFLSPLGLYIEQIQEGYNLEVTEQSKVKNFAKKTKMKPKKHSFNSQYLGGVVNFHSSNYWEFLPHINVKGKKASLGLVVIDTKTDERVILTKKESKVNLAPTFEKWKAYDPLLKYMDQDAFNVLSGKSESNKIYGRKIVDSLSLNMENIALLPQKTGPFIAFPLLLKKEFSELVPQIKTHKTDIYELHDAYLFSFVKGKKYQTLKLKGLAFTEYKVDLVDPKSKGKKLQKAVIGQVLTQVKGSKKLKHEEEDSNWSKDLDLFAKIVETNKLPAADKKYLEKRILSRALRAYNEDNAPLKEGLIAMIKSLDKALLFFISQSKDSQLAEFRLSIITIQKALSEGDAKFFKANTK